MPHSARSMPRRLGRRSQANRRHQPACGWRFCRRRQCGHVRIAASQAALPALLVQVALGIGRQASSRRRQRGCTADAAGTGTSPTAGVRRRGARRAASERLLHDTTMKAAASCRRRRDFRDCWLHMMMWSGRAREYQFDARRKHSPR